MKGRKFNVILTRDEDNIFTAKCVELMGCISQGKTKKKALANIRDAIKGYLASLKKRKEIVPIAKEFYLTEITVS